MEKEIEGKMKSINKLRVLTLISYLVALFLALFFIIRAIALRALDYRILLLTLLIYAISSFVIEKKYTAVFIKENMILSLSKYLSSVTFSKKGSVEKSDVIDTGVYPLSADDGKSFISSDEARGERNGAKCTFSSFISYFPDTRSGSKHKFALMKGMYISSKLSSDTSYDIAFGSYGVLDEDVADQFFRGQGLTEVKISDDFFSYSRGSIPGSLEKAICNLLSQCSLKDVKVVLRIKGDKLVLVEKDKEVNVKLPLLKSPSPDVLYAPALPALGEYFTLLDNLERGEKRI